MKLDWRRERLLEWLCTVKDDRQPGTQQELADELGATPAELSKWKADPAFLAVWETMYRKTVGSPEKAHAVLNALHETATDRTDPRQVPAARAYLEAIDAIKPKKVDVTVTQGKAASALTDDELFAMLADRATDELANRIEQRDGDQLVRNGYEGGLNEATRRAIFDLRRRLVNLEEIVAEIDGGGTGPGGPVSYVHNQGTVSATWSIAHGLGWYPNVTVVDSGGTTVEGDIHQVNDNLLTITFSGAFTGTAFLS